MRLAHIVNDRSCFLEIHGINHWQGDLRQQTVDVKGVVKNLRHIRLLRHHLNPPFVPRAQKLD